MSHQQILWRGAIAAVAMVLTQGVSAVVSAGEAEQLKTTLTPLGGEKAGNKDGSIPAWTGGYTTPMPGFKNGGKRGDPFASDKPLYSITAKNMAQYADKLSDGTKAMFAKYPDTYRMDVYPTRRTASAPQWVYDNTFKNATRAKIVEGPGGSMPEGAFGGIPFPVPKSGVEVMWNHTLRWRGESFHIHVNGVLVTADGKRVQTVDALGDEQIPYYAKDADPSKFNGDYWLFRLINVGPPVRAGEGIVVRYNVAGTDQSWVYLTGQRRVRKLPNSCCDTPSPASAGVMSFDEAEMFTGTTSRFNWRLLGKKELLIPYNNNKLFLLSDNELTGTRHLNPDHLRWELHRVWVVEATLKEGQRHQAAKSVYYMEEDTWGGALADRYDAKGQLWKTLWAAHAVLPDLPGTVLTSFGFYDLLSGSWFANGLYGEKSEQIKFMPRYPEAVFTPDGLISEGVR